MFGSEPKPGRLPLAASVAMGDVMARTAHTRDPAQIERIHRSVANKLAATVSDATDRMRFRCNTFSTHLEGLMRAGIGELVVAAGDRKNPTVAEVCKSYLMKAGGKDSSHSMQVAATASAMKLAFEEAKRAIDTTQRVWREDGITTEEARHAIEGVLTRMHAIGKTAITFLDKVGDANGNAMGREARVFYQDVIESAGAVVHQFDRHDEQVAQVAKQTKRPGMTM